MIVPKNNIKYKSVKSIKVNPKKKYLSSLQIACYNGNFPMHCHDCHLSSSCWFFGLKPFKG